MNKLPYNLIDLNRIAYIMDLLPGANIYKIFEAAVKLHSENKKNIFFYHGGYDITVIISKGKFKVEDVKND